MSKLNVVIPFVSNFLSKAQLCEQFNVVKAQIWEQLNKRSMIELMCPV